MSRVYLSVITEINLNAVPGKPAMECFIGRAWTYRDQRFDTSVLYNQPYADACTIVSCECMQDIRFRDLLGALPGISLDLDIVQLGNRLIELGYTMTLPQVESLVSKCEFGTRVGLQVEQRGNYFFVRSNTPRAPVLVGVLVNHRTWAIRLSEIAPQERVNQGCRFLIRNLDVSQI